MIFFIKNKSEREKEFLIRFNMEDSTLKISGYEPIVRNFIYETKPSEIALNESYWTTDKESQLEVMQLIRYKIPSLEEVILSIQACSRDYIKRKRSSNHKKDRVLGFLKTQIDWDLSYLDSNRSVCGNILNDIAKGDKKVIQSLKRHLKGYLPIKDNSEEEYLELTVATLSRKDIEEYQKEKGESLSCIQNHEFFKLPHKLSKLFRNYKIRIDNGRLYSLDVVEDYIRNYQYVSNGLRNDGKDNRLSIAFKMENEHIENTINIDSRIDSIKRIRSIYSAIDSEEKIKLIPDFSERSLIINTSASIFRISQDFQAKELSNIVRLYQDSGLFY